MRFIIGDLSIYRGSEHNRGSETQALRNPLLHLNRNSGVPNILQHEIITQFLPLKFQLSMIFILISSSAFLVWLNQHLCFTSGMTMFQWRMKFIWRIKINFIKTSNRNFELTVSKSYLSISLTLFWCNVFQIYSPCSLFPKPLWKVKGMYKRCYTEE